MAASEAGMRLVAAERGASGPYLELTDADLFGALDLSRPGLEAGRAAVAAGDVTAAYAAWGRYWAGRERPLYYLDDRTYARDLAAQAPELRQVIIAQADAVTAPDFQFSTYRPKRVGRTFQWADNSTADTAYIGFHYWFWAGPVGRAYLLTGNEAYAELVRDLICTWWAAVPDMAETARCGSHDGLAVLWNAGLGSSLRSLIMVDGYWAARRSPAFTPELHAAMLRIVLGHARCIHDRYTRSYSHSNLQASQCCWLATAALLFPEFREAEGWLSSALALTRERILTNYDRDGAQLEMCPQYHFTGMRDITRIAWLLERNGRRDISGDPEQWQALQRIYDVTVRLAHPTGHGAVVNSAVYGTDWLVFMPIGARLFGSDLHAWAAQRFIAPGFVPVAKGVSEYALFVDGPWCEALAAARRRPPPPPSFTSDLLADAGLAVLRSGWDPDARSLVLDCCRQPLGGHPYPGRLSFDLWAYGKAMVVNPGSTLSYSMPEYGRWCHTTVGHNTVMIGGKDQGKPHTARLEGWHAGAHVVVAAAATDTYRQACGVVHRRAVLLVGGEYVLVADRLEGGSAGTPAAWLLHSPLPLARTATGLASAAGQPGLLLTFAAGWPDPGRLTLGRSYGAVPVSYRPGFRPTDAWSAERTFVRWDAPLPDAPAWCLPVALLMPFRDTPPVEIVVAQSDTADGCQVTVRTPEWTDTLTLAWHADGSAGFSAERRDRNSLRRWADTSKEQ